MSDLYIAYHHWEVPVTAELDDDLLIKPPLVVFERQEQVGALLSGELKKRRRIMQGVCVDQNAVELKGTEQGFEGREPCNSTVSNEVWAIATPSSMA